MICIDLNCDMGEGFGPWPMGNDAALMPYISAANIACGFHAGDPATMRHTVRLALQHKVAIGAHPGLPDLQGFGRREMKLSPDEVFDLTIYQIGALQAIAKAEGGYVRHVKPHGALYNMAARDPALAEAIANATKLADENLILYGLSGSQLIQAAKALGLRTASEVFADRSYQDDGALTPRTQAGALISSTPDALAQAMQMIEKQSVQTLSGKIISLKADTLCLHGDGPHALEFAAAIHAALKEKDVRIQPPSV